jgi:hypothetical protein
MVPQAIFGRAKICFLDAALGADCFQIGCASPALRSTQSLRAPEPQSPRAPEPQSPRAPEPQSPRAPEPQSPRAPEPQSLSAVANAASSDPSSPAVEPVKCGVAGSFGWQRRLANAVTEPNGSTSAFVAPLLRRAATRVEGHCSECMHLQTIMTCQSGIRVKRLASVR